MSILTADFLQKRKTSRFALDFLLNGEALFAQGARATILVKPGSVRRAGGLLE